MSALLQKYQNIQNYYMSWTSRVERLNVPREVVIQIVNAENNVTHLAELKELLRNYNDLASKSTS